MEEVEGLAGVCAGLGCPSQEPGVHYIKGEHCLENLKNLQRFLRRDHPTNRPVFKQLGKWNTVGQDLVPILVQYRDDPELTINAVKVVVFLTMPVDATTEGVSQQLDYLLKFKASFLHNDAIAVVMTLLEEPLEHLESDTFSEDDCKLVQLILTLIRNLLDFQDVLTQKVAIMEKTSFCSIRDELLEHLFEENVMDLLLALAQHVAGPFGHLQRDSMLFLEIFHHIFWGQIPEKIARASQIHIKEKCLTNSSGLLRKMMEEEKEQLKEIHLQDLSRHSQFSGLFVRVAEDGSKKILRRNPFQSPIETVLRGPRFKHGPVKRVACERTIVSTSERKILELLKGFADQVLSGSYNGVMKSVKDDISRERDGIQSAEAILFFQVAKFFTAYQRQKIIDFKQQGSDNFSQLFEGHLCGPIAVTMTEDIFRMVISKWHEFSEAAKVTNDWLSVTVTGTLFKEMIRVLDTVLKEAKSIFQDEQQCRVARILLYKVFYDQTEKGIIQLLLHLVKLFEVHKQPRSHLADLVETVHVVLRIMEFLTNEDGALRVLKKGRKPNTKLKMEGVKETGQAQVNIEGPGTTDCDGNTISPTSADQPALNAEQTVSDAETGVRCDEQRKSPEHVTELPHSREDDEEASVEETAKFNVEVSLDVQKCAAIFADNTVVRNYCWLLKHFESNTPAINHYIICMLQRICKDQCLEPMLYQLSLMRTFYEILSNTKASKLEQHQRLFAFLTKLIRSFFKKLKSQPLLFLDILFWKNRQDCHIISLDYQSEALNRAFGKTAKHNRKRSLADALGNDEDDAICPLVEALGNELGGNQERSQVSEKSDSTKRQKRKRNVFTVEQEVQLQELFEQYKEKPRCCLLLAQVVDPEGKITAAQVKKKLQQWGLFPSVHKKPNPSGKDGTTSQTKAKRARTKKIESKASGGQESDEEETLSQIAEELRSDTKRSKGDSRLRESLKSKSETELEQETPLQDLVLTIRKKIVSAITGEDPSMVVEDVTPLQSAKEKLDHQDMLIESPTKPKRDNGENNDTVPGPDLEDDLGEVPDTGVHSPPGFRKRRTMYVSDDDEV